MALREWFVYVVESPAFFDIIVRMVLMPMGTLETTVYLVLMGPLSMGGGNKPLDLSAIWRNKSPTFSPNIYQNHR